MWSEEGVGRLVHLPLGFDATIDVSLSLLVAVSRMILVPEGTGVEGLAEAIQEEEEPTL